MSLTVYHGCWLSFTVSQVERIVKFLSLSLIVSGCLSLSILVPWIFRMSITVTYFCWRSLYSIELVVKFREYKLKTETVRDMQQLHGARKESERPPAIIRDSERHAATPWDCERQWEKASNYGRLWVTWRNYMELKETVRGSNQQ